MEESKVNIALSMRNVSKRFPGTLAVDGVDFEVYSGEVHALVGENGAGKSTLMKMIAGSFDDYEGQIFINGKEVQLHSPAISKRMGVGMIYQELSLAKPISIAENLLVGRLPVKYGFVVDKKAMVEQTREALRKVGLEHLDPMTPVEDISQHQAQLVEIAKVLENNPSILVMDEPTSALSREEVEMLFEIIDRLKKQGLAIIYISHHLSEIFRVADRVTVMRDGKRIATKKISEVTTNQLVQMMVGHTIDEFYAKRESKIGEERLVVQHLTRYGFFHDISFAARKGEILGIVGLTGSGRTELARCICGLDPIDDGKIIMEGKEITPKSLSEAMEYGLGYLTEDRKAQGLFLRLSMDENLKAVLIPKHCTAGVYSPRKAKGITTKLIQQLDIMPPIPYLEVNNLSGGNQQKVLLAKWLATEPKVLMLDEPTRGVDVGAKMTIHKVIMDLADKGVTVILISSDLPELVGLSDRAIVMRNGHIIGEMQKEDLSEESALLAANGEGDVCNVCS